MSIPLVQNNEKDSINTSIIAIKRNIERINMLLGLSNSEEIDTSEFVKKSDIVDEVEAGNMNPVTSNAVVPVDEVTLGNMHSVTSNAVYKAIDDTVKNERSFYYGAVTRGDHTRPVSVSFYEAGIICAIRQGVGTGVFAFTTNGSGNGFATTNLLSGADIRGYMSRNNNSVTIDNGIFTVLQW